VRKKAALAQTMISDCEIWACAVAVLRSHGEAAAFHAAQRADELIAVSDIEGQRTWRRILKKIEELEREKPAEGQLMQ
jgi:hypothetical protein